MTEIDDEIQYAIDEFDHARKELTKATLSDDLTKVVGARYAVEMARSSCKILGIDPDLISEDGTYEGEL